MGMDNRNQNEKHNEQKPNPDRNIDPQKKAGSYSQERDKKPGEPNRQPNNPQKH